MNKNKKYKLGSIFVLVSIILIAFLAIRASAEDAATAKEIENEKHLVKRMASISRAMDENDQVNKDTLEELLNKYAGSGATSVTEESSDTLKVTFVGSSREYEVNINTGPMIRGGGAGTGLPSTEYTTPYLPTGFTPVSGTDLNTGLVIQDSLGNQYVWVEVPRTTIVYPNAGLSITSFTDTEYTSIENDLHTYTSVYRNGTSYTDTWYSEAQHGFASADDYNALKQKMLKSVYQNGGFYVGRYETGIADSEPDLIDTTVEARTASGDTTQTPVIQANAYPYNFVTNKQAQTLASTKFATGGYTTSLMFGVQWDLILKYLETKAVEKGETLATIQSELNSNSTSWGNYQNNLWTITNASSKYAVSSAYAWTDGAYGTKASSFSVVLSTGASSEFSKQNISDLAGNVYEWTLEYTSDTNYPCAERGGSYGYNGSSYPASSRNNHRTTNETHNNGFRVSLY